jgi:hypothetical protein
MGFAGMVVGRTFCVRPVGGRSCEVEVRDLVALVDHALSEFGMEIADTDNAELRRDLEGRRLHLHGVRAKLG